MAYKIVLDAGHGGFKDKQKKIYATAGKRTPDGIPEWEFNNKVALYCEERLHQYGKFEILRVDDVSGKTDVPLRTRSTKANNWNADIYVSIHQNALNSKWGNHGGTETFYYSTNSNGKRLAQIVQNQIVKAMGLRNRGIKTGNHLHVVRETKMTAILTEGFFMDSLIDCYAREGDMLKKQGYAIADGIAEYFSVKLDNKTVKQPPNSPSQPKQDNTYYRIQSGAYSSETLANQARMNLGKHNIANATYTRIEKGSDGRYRLITGTYRTYDVAKNALDKALKLGVLLYGEIRED